MKSTVLEYRQSASLIALEASPNLEEALERAMALEVGKKLVEYLRLNGPAVIGRPRFDRSYSALRALPDRWDTMEKRLRVEVWPLDDPYAGFDKVSGPVQMPVAREWFR